MFLSKTKIAIREIIINYIDKSRNGQITIDVYLPAQKLFDGVALVMLSLPVSTSRARYEPLVCIA